MHYIALVAVFNALANFYIDCGNPLAVGKFSGAYDPSLAYIPCVKEGLWWTYFDPEWQREFLLICASTWAHDFMQDNAARPMVEWSSDAWEHNQFKDLVWVANIKMYIDLQRHHDVLIMH